MKGHYTEYDKGRFGAQAVLGELWIRPTVAMMARALEISEYMVGLALPRTRIHPPAQTAVVLWDTMSTVERDDFVRARLTEMWPHFDSATSPRIRHQDAA
jgi:hypothetical protein